MALAVNGLGVDLAIVAKIICSTILRMDIMSSILTTGVVFLKRPKI